MDTGAMRLVEEVTFVGAMDRRRHNDARIEINRVLRFVREMRRAVLHLGDLRVRIGLARPNLVRQLLAFALAVKLDEVVDRRHLDAALLSHPRQHLAIGQTVSSFQIQRVLLLKSKTDLGQAVRLIYKRKTDRLEDTATPFIYQLRRVGFTQNEIAKLFKVAP
jgi:hypothetical protein